MWKQLVRMAAEGARNALFPPFCIACETPGAWVCHSCFEDIPIARVDHPQHIPGIDAVIAISPYGHPVVQRLVKHVKYDRALCLEQALTELLHRGRDYRGTPWPWAGESALTLVALPGDADRVVARGLDHAAWIASLVQKTCLPWGMIVPALERTRSIAPQAQLPSDIYRAVNVAGAFGIVRPVVGPVVLIDDVVTTGATAAEAARVLRAAGAGPIWLFTLAHGK